MAECERLAKARLASYIHRHMDILLPIDALYDIHVKRIHEYKRQLMNALYCIHRYLKIKSMSPEERSQVVPRVTIFAGKAAPGYDTAKLIVKFINDIGTIVNSDPDIGDLFKVVFIPNYKVSSAEVIIPASDISQHVSTAGMEASGTRYSTILPLLVDCPNCVSNMKFIMNGGLIIGTMDGANVEISKECGEENMFIFGARAEEVPRLRNELAYEDGSDFKGYKELRVVLEFMRHRMISASVIEPILNSLRPFNDYYLVTRDFEPYLKAQQRVDECYRMKEKLVIVAIDFCKAFDSIDRQALIEGLKYYKCEPRVIEVIVRMYDGDKTEIWKEGEENGRARGGKWY